MAINWKLEKQIATTLTEKSLFVVLWDTETDEYRRTEIPHVPQSVTGLSSLQSWVTGTGGYTLASLWSAGVTLDDDEIAWLKAKRALNGIDIDTEVTNLATAKAVLQDIIDVLRWNEMRWGEFD